MIEAGSLIFFYIILPFILWITSTPYLGKLLTLLTLFTMFINHLGENNILFKAREIIAMLFFYSLKIILYAFLGVIKVFFFPMLVGIVFNLIGFLIEWDLIFLKLLIFSVIGVFACVVLVFLVAFILEVFDNLEKHKYVIFYGFLILISLMNNSL